MKSLEGGSRSKSLDCKGSLSQFFERKSEDGQKVAKELDQTDEDFQKVRIAIAVLTATQTFWKPLAPPTTRQARAQSCKDRLTALKLPLPTVWAELLDAEVDKVE